MVDSLQRLQEVLGSRYRLDHEVGRGAAAIVFLAEDTKHHRSVAVKMLRPGHTDDVTHGRFLREIEIVSRLNHPHILPLYDSGAQNGVFYYVMPFIAGPTLRDRLDAGPRLSVEEVARILYQVAEGIAYAHSEGVVHRDLKPGNILFQADHALIADFGIARAAFPVSENSLSWEDTLSKPGTAVGTPAYMSPEQVAGLRDVDHRADVYAIGAIAYEMLSGNPPFVRPTLLQTTVAQIRDPPCPLHTLNRDVPDCLSDIVMRCLEKNRAARPQSAAEIVQGLKPVWKDQADESVAQEIVASYDRVLECALALYAVILIAAAGIVWIITLRAGSPAWVFPSAVAGMILLPMTSCYVYVRAHHVIRGRADDAD